MTNGKPPTPPVLRDRWPLLPPRIAQAVLAVLYAALDRRPPFEAIKRSRFDVALGTMPPPPGLTREQARRAVFEELNYLPWSDGLEPPEGVSWRRYAPVATGVDRVFVIPVHPYRLTRKTAKGVVDRMRADGTLGPGVGVELNGGIDIHQDSSGDIRIGHVVRAVYRAAPFLHSELTIDFLDRPPCMLRPSAIFLDPNLGDMTSDEEVERVIRRMWRYGDALFRALVEALPGSPSDGATPP